MVLTPEERQRIYEEEKARRQAKAQLDDLDRRSADLQRRNTFIGCAGLVVLILIGFLILVGTLPDERVTTGTGRSPAVPPPPPDTVLALLASSGGPSAGGAYIEVKGRVQNVSQRPISNLMATVELFDKRGEFISADHALVEFDPVLPGQATPFTVLIRGNPATEKYLVRFKTMGGPELHFHDKRGQRR